MLLEHLYGFYVIYPCTIAHEPPYQTYSSVGQAGFRRHFPRTNDHTRFTLMWGSPQLFIGMGAYSNPSKFQKDSICYCGLHDYRAKTYGQRLTSNYCSSI